MKPATHSLIRPFRCARDCGRFFLIAKLSWRQNIRSLRIPRRLFFARSQLRMLSSFAWYAPCGPASAVGLGLANPVSCGQRAAFHRILKAIAHKLRIPDDSRYVRHAFHGVAAHGLKESGNPWSAVACSGLWRPPAYRGYLDLARDVEAAPNSCSTSTATRIRCPNRYGVALLLGKPLDRPAAAAGHCVLGLPASTRADSG